MERLIDTAIAGVIVFLVSYLVLPVWEHQKNRTFMLNYILANHKYLNTIIEILQQKKIFLFKTIKSAENTLW